MKIVPSDIEPNIYGFRCRKIKYLSNKKHSELEDELRMAGFSVSWTNTEEMNYLTACWVNIKTISEEEKIKICTILNKITNSYNK